MLQQLFRGKNRISQGASGVTSGFRLGFVASGLLHLAVLLLLLIGLPVSTPKDEEPLEPTVAMVFESDAKASIRAPVQAAVSTPAQESVPPAPPVTAMPEPRPIEAPPPPPPPPQTHAEPAPPIQAPSPPMPPLEPIPAPPIVPAPPAPPTLPTPAPAKAEPPLPVPPQPVPQPVPPPGTTPQPNATKNPAPSSSSVENTLEKLRQQMARSTPGKNRPNPQAGGQPDGGSPLGDDTTALSVDQRGAIGEHVRECWTKDAGALDIDKQRVLLTVITDATGVARRAEVAGDDVGRMADPRFRAFAERARRAIMDPRCASLPLPNNVLGKVNTLTFRFSP